jgi:ring-1,2-phenylacetyl-CoA epoxidase subunit PaaE
VFYQLPIQRVWNETSDAVAISFDVPEALRDVFTYKHGQYITLKTDIDGANERRAYSLCSSPYLDEPLTIAVKKVSDGKMSTWLNEHVRQGAMLDVMAPMGSFTIALSPDNARHILCFAGGSGITPILSIIKSTLVVEPSSRVTLVFANVSDTSVMFTEQLAHLRNQYPDRFAVVHVLEADRAGIAHITGRLNEHSIAGLLEEVVQKFDDVEAFLCGPEGLMNVARAYLLAHGLPIERIHQEYFSISTTSETAMSESSAELVTRTVKIRLYGQDHEFDVQPDETFLSAAQRANLDPPYACQIGACCTCRAKLVTGSAIMDEREALSDDEIADGYILTCQAHPTSDGCFADYDQ